MASQIIGVTIVYSTVCSGADQRKYQISASLAFVRGIHRRPVNSQHERPVAWKMFPFDDVIMYIWGKLAYIKLYCSCNHWFLQFTAILLPVRDVKRYKRYFTLMWACGIYPSRDLNKYLWGHFNVISRKYFPHYYKKGIHRSLVDFHHRRTVICIFDILLLLAEKPLTLQLSCRWLRHYDENYS